VTTAPTTAGCAPVRPVRGGRGAAVAGGRQESWALGVTAVGMTTVLLVLLVPALRHWFVLPVAACGTLVAPDAVDWARRRLDTFDLQAVIGVVGLHFFFLTPLLHVTLDSWPRYLVPPADWRHALGQMALLNLLGLTLYRFVLARPAAGRRGGAARAPARTDPARLQLAGALCAASSVVAFCWLVRQLGGVGGYLGTVADSREELVGMGTALLAAGQFPLLAFAVVVVRWRVYLRAHPAVTMALVAALAVAQLVAGGLGGSRSHTVWPVMAGICMCHLAVARVRRRVLVAAFAVAVAFMYLYGLYKSAGSAVLDVLSGATTASELSAQTGRDLELLLLADLGRADIQALTLDRQREGAAAVGHGVTYVGDLAFLVPDRILPDPPADKVELGTDMLFGSGAYASGLRSTHIFGLAGEGILNFGSAGAVMAFVALGLFVRSAGGLYRRAAGGRAGPGGTGGGDGGDGDDGAVGGRLLAATLPTAAVLVLGSDLGNLAWFAANHVAVLAAVVFLARTRPLRPPGSTRPVRAPRPRPECLP
jgi:hypothetical protein